MKGNLLRMAAAIALALAFAGCQKDDKPGSKAPGGSHTLRSSDKWTGEAIFIERCRDCHRVHETGGVVGPDLSSVGSRRDPTFLESTVRNPSREYPGTVMPPYDTLPAEQIKLVVGYLGRLK